MNARARWSRGTSCRAALWPADTFVDFDHSLNAAVRRLRDALGDTAENPRFVETVARRGYRFLAPVNGAAHPVVSEIPVPKLPNPLPNGGSPAAAGVLLLVGTGVGLFVGRRGSHPSSPSTPIVERRLTANPDDDPVSSAAHLSGWKVSGFFRRHRILPAPDRYWRNTSFSSCPMDSRRSRSPGFPDGSHIWRLRLQDRPKNPACGNSPPWAEVRANSSTTRRKLRSRPTALRLYFSEELPTARNSG